MPNMSRIPLAILAACLASPGLAETTPAPVTISGFSHPESVLIAPSLRYVSNIGADLAPLAKDGDGFISILDADGAIIELRGFTGMDAPKGMALVRGVLYVADIDRVIGFDPETRDQVFSANMDCPQPCLLNDIVATGDKLLVSDTVRGQLYELDPASGSFTLLAEGIPGANGLAWDEARDEAVIVALGSDFGGGHVFTWSAAEGLAQIPDSPFGVFDGLALLPDGDLLVSDWVSLTPRPGAMLRINPNTGAASEVALPMPIRGPADFAFDAAGNRLWIPATLDGAVNIVATPGP